MESKKQMVIVKNLDSLKHLRNWMGLEKNLATLKMKGCKKLKVTEKHLSLMTEIMKKMEIVMSLVNMKHLETMMG